jgi:Uma2 family endonuclease
MATLPHSRPITIEEYLDTSYQDGDREFLDGVVVERNLGERPHSMVQGNIVAYFRSHFPHLFVWPEQRILTLGTRRARVPDICVTTADPRIDVFQAPPFIVIEILSKRDEPVDVLEKVAEYHTFGVPHIWVIDPRRKKAFQHDQGFPKEVGAAFQAADVELPLEAVFQGLS